MSPAIPVPYAGIRVLGAVLVGALLAAASVGSALAAKPTTEARNLDFAFSFVETGMCPGLTLEFAFEGTRTRMLYYDRDGNERQLVIHVRSTGTYTNLDDPSLVLTSSSIRNITFDYANDTFTDTGAYRNVTAPGEGIVLQQTGRWLETLDETPLAISGPHEEWLGQVDAFCAALGG